MEDFYNQITKRRSIRKYDSALSENELTMIKDFISKINPLDPSIKVEFHILEASKTNVRFGQYVLVAYSENKDNYLLNIGYMIEQFDLFLTKNNIGGCWYGFGHDPKDHITSELPFVIMYTFGHCDVSLFRDNSLDYNRKDISSFININNEYTKLIEESFLAPSGCNSQPWTVIASNNVLDIYRNREAPSIMSKRRKAFYNRIDLGIYLYYLDLILKHKNITYSRVLKPVNNTEDTLEDIARYTIL